MIQIARNLGLVAALLLLPLSTQAVEISVTATSSGGDTSLLQPGDIITFDLYLTHTSGEDLFGLGIGVRGYDSNQNGLSDDGLTFFGPFLDNEGNPTFMGPNVQNTTIPEFFAPIDTTGTANVADFIFGIDDGTGNQIHRKQNPEACAGPNSRPREAKLRPEGRDRERHREPRKHQHVWNNLMLHVDNKDGKEEGGISHQGVCFVARPVSGPD